MSSSASPTTRTSSLIHITRLARGGMGTVDLVMRRSGDFTRFYALKRPHPDLTDEPTLRAMFLEEARIAGLLRHPNVVPVLDVGEDEQGPFLLMDFVEGVALTEILRGHPGHLPVEIVVEILRQVALGLEAAHELHGVDGEPLALVHRDVSPQNVLVGFDGVVRLTDFGIAKAVGTQSPATGQVLKGKIGYMSPEQLRFEPIDRRSDLFALGVLFYEALARARLYGRGAVDEVAARILHEPPPDLADHRADLPPALEELLLDLLAKDRELRPATAHDVVDRLDAILSDLDAPPRGLAAFMTEHYGERRREQADARRLAVAAAEAPVEPATEAPAPPRRGATIALVAGVLVGVLALAGAVSFYAMPREAAVEPRPAAPPPVVEAPDAPVPDVAVAVEPAPPEPPAAPASADPADAEPEAAPSTPARRSRRRTRSRSAGEGTLSGDLWGWEGER